MGGLCPQKVQDPQPAQSTQGAHQKQSGQSDAGRGQGQNSTEHGNMRGKAPGKGELAPLLSDEHNSGQEHPGQKPTNRSVKVTDTKIDETSQNQSPAVLGPVKQQRQSKDLQSSGLDTSQTMQSVQTSGKPEHEKSLSEPQPIVSQTPAHSEKQEVQLPDNLIEPSLNQVLDVEVGATQQQVGQPSGGHVTQEPVTSDGLRHKAEPIEAGTTDIQEEQVMESQPELPDSTEPRKSLGNSNLEGSFDMEWNRQSQHNSLFGRVASLTEKGFTLVEVIES